MLVSLLFASSEVFRQRRRPTYKIVDVAVCPASQLCVRVRGRPQLSNVSEHQVSQDVNCRFVHSMKASCLGQLSYNNFGDLSGVALRHRL